MNPHILNNHRLILNFPFMSKLLERAVAEQLHMYISHNSIFEKFESGYQSCHSTETVLTRVIHDLLLTVNSLLKEAREDKT